MMSMVENSLNRKHKKIAVGLILIFIFCSFSIVFAKDSVSSEGLQSDDARKYVLDNGMTIITKRITTGSLVSLAFVVKAGSATEGKFLGSGISHFVEHMLFKGTVKSKPGEIFREIESLGGEINGFTTYDYTGYTITLPREELNRALEILADAIMNPQFDPEELEKERDVILGEIRLYQDNPERELSRLFFGNAYIRHPYRYPIIGYEPLLRSLKRDDLAGYYRRVYIPNNIVLTVTGDVDRDALLSKINKEFKEFKKRPYVLRNVPSEPRQLSLRRVEDEYPTKLTRMLLGFKSISIADKDLFALDVLAMILGRGESSRLYRQIYKNKGLVYSIGAFNLTPMDKGIFGIRCTLDNEKIDQAIEAIYSEIDKVKKGEIGIQELDKAKRQVISGYIFSRQTTAGVAHDLAINEVLAGDFDFSKEYVKAVEALNLDDVRNAAKKYLNKEALTIAILNPPVPKKETAKKTEKNTPEIKKIILDNGLTVLLREDSNYPLVSIKAIFSGGVRVETADNNGISNLASRMLLRGTETRSSRVIAEIIESLGGEINTFSGNNSFGISLDILSRDLDEGMEVLADIVANPVFPEDELSLEKELISSQIKTQDDNIFKLAFKALKKILFKAHPYRFDPLGEEESLKAISRRDVAEFYGNFCLPGNMVLTVFGDIKSKSALELIKNKFGRLAPKELIRILPEESALKKSEQSTIYAPKEQTVIMLGFSGVKFRNPARFSFEVLNSILTSSGGRLYQKIREEFGQAYTLGGASVPGVDTGFYYLYVSTTALNLNKIKEIILAEIKDLRTKYVDEKELFAAKAYLAGIQKMNLETNSSLAIKGALDELYGLGFNSYNLYQEKINEVTKEDIMRAAKLYLDINRMAVVVVRPKVNK